jgi:glycosyltransferase involved in cell wall biosynthesis
VVVTADEGAPPALTVVVMAYNEANNLEAVVREIRAAVDRVGRRAEILVVDDGSTDGTGTLADGLAALIPGLRVVHHAPNGGLGAVYRTGFAQARGELLTFFPADGQFPASILESFVPAMEGQDMVLGYVPRRDSVVGRLLSGAERVAYRVLLGPMPRFQGVFMVRRVALARIPLRSEGRGWAIVMELMARASRAGWRMTSLPTAIRPRRSGVSKVQNARTIWSNLRQVIALRGRL